MRLLEHQLALALVAVVACGSDDETTPERTTTESDRIEAVATTNDLATPTKVKVYKTASCGCCSGWVEHLRTAGFEVEIEIQETDDLARVNSELGVPPELESCHTAEVAGYVIEGHVPADVIARLLTERPDVIGIAVPGMPTGSPGMETSSGRTEPFDIVSFDQEGQILVYETR